MAVALGLRVSFSGRVGSGEACGASTGLAIFHTCRGEIDLAADWFEKAIEERYAIVLGGADESTRSRVIASQTASRFCKAEIHAVSGAGLIRAEATPCTERP